MCHRYWKKYWERSSLKKKPSDQNLPPMFHSPSFARCSAILSRILGRIVSGILGRILVDSWELLVISSQAFLSLGRMGVKMGVEEASGISPEETTRRNNRKTRPTKTFAILTVNSYTLRGWECDLSEMKVPRPSSAFSVRVSSKRFFATIF